MNQSKVKFKTHMRKEISVADNSGDQGLSICMNYGYLTSDADKVDCKRCMRILEKQESKNV